MKKIQLLAIVMFLGLQNFMYASGVKVTAPGAIAVYNASNLPVKATWVGASNTAGTTSTLIPAGGVASLAYTADTITQITVTYYKADGVTVRDAVPLTFVPTVIAKNLFIFGNNSFEIGVLDTSNAATPIPSRFIAWWSNSIDVTKYTTAAQAIADPTTMAGLVSLYMMSLDGKNTMLPAF